MKWLDIIAVRSQTHISVYGYPVNLPKFSLFGPS